MPDSAEGAGRPATGPVRRAPPALLRAFRWGSFLLLNVYFAWTAHVFIDASHSLDVGVAYLLVHLDRYLWNAVELHGLTTNVQLAADVTALGVFGLFVVATAIASRGGGARRAVLLSVQAGALCLAILGSEIGVFDYGEFYLHVTEAQAVLGLVPWFSNADLLFLALASLAASTALLRMSPFASRSQHAAGGDNNGLRATLGGTE